MASASVLNAVKEAGSDHTVKIVHEDGWALILPDPDEPVTHVWAEGPSDVEARHLAQEYARRYAAAWANTKDALEWLTARLPPDLKTERR